MDEEYSDVPANDAVVTRMLIILDDQNRKRIVAGVDNETGRPFFMINDRNGTSRIVIAMNQDEPKIVLSDDLGAPRFAAEVKPDGKVHLLLIDDQGNPHGSILTAEGELLQIP